jgi:diguanylate cyclase (GGDEF)-like protein
VAFIRLVGWVGLALLVGVYVAALYSPLSMAGRLAVLEIAYSLPITLTIVLGCIAAYRSTGVERRFWGLLAAANAALLLCEVLLSLWIAFISPVGPPSISWPFQLLHLVAAVCFVGLVVSMTRLQDDHLAARVRVSLDFCALAVLLYVLILDLYARPVMVTTGQPVSTILIGAIYPLVSLLLVFGTLGNLVGFKFVRWRSWEMLAAIALGVYAIAIALWPLWSTTVAGTTRNFSRGLLDLIQLSGHYLLMMAAVYRLTEPTEWRLRPLPLPSLARNRWLSSVLPVATVISIPILGIAAFSAHGEGAWFAVYGGLAVLLTALVMGRSLLLAFEHSMLFHRSVTDPLTGLHNHRFFHDRLREEVDRARRYGDEVALIVLDVDDFAGFNRANGHLAGDRLLSELGSKLNAACTGNEVVARLGGDEFGVIVPESGSSDASVLCQRMLDVIGIEAGLVPGGLSASAGVASFPSDADEPDELLRRADGALFHAKETGKGRTVVFEPGRVPDLNARERIDRLERQSRVSAVRALAAAVDERDPATRFHSQQVAALALRLASRLGVDDQKVRLIEQAALMHDVGKLAVSDSVLNKSGELTAAEWREVRGHSERGQHILASADLTELVPWVRAHHERWDGSGYPDGLSAHEIPLEARILAVCDAFDAMTSDRAYRAAMPLKDALAEIRSGAGGQFDAQVAGAFVEMLEAEGAPQRAASSLGSRAVAHIAELVPRADLSPEQA